MDSIVLIDGNSVLNRAYFALPPLNDKNGVNVNAVFGFVNIMLKVLADIKPTHLVVAFDKRGKNFRKDIYSGYKGNRKGMPDDLALQMPILEELLNSMQIKVVAIAGVEADDIIGTLSKKFTETAYILTGDKDLLQLIDKSTTVMLTKQKANEIEIVDTAFLKEKYLLTPSQIIDYKSLCGDPSDSIPGVKGIGDKTAMTLLNDYSDLNGVYNNLDNIKESVATKLRSDKDSAFMSYKLATIVTNLDIDCNFNECKITKFKPVVKDKLDQLEFKSLIKRMEFDESIVLPTTDEIKKIEIKDEETLDKIIRRLLDKSIKRFAFHLEKDIYFASDEVSEYVIEISDNFLDGISFDSALAKLKPILESDIIKVIYDSKQLRHILLNYDIKLNSVKYDLSIMQYLLEYRSYKDVTSLLEHYNLNNFATSFIKISNILQAELENTNTLNLYNEIELPLCEVLFDMEKEGFKVDTVILNELLDKYNTEIASLTESIFVLCGEKFNINSPKQLGVILFEKLNLKHGKKTKTGFSTNVDVLESLIDAHPVIPLIMKIRQLSKLTGTYLEGLKPLIVKNSLIHTTFKQTLTSTGRLTSTEPNLQNLPVRDDLGKEIRKMFIPKYDLLVSADYSQIELRLLAHFSSDENLISNFNSGKDIHTLVASEIFGIPQELVNSNMRRMAKAVNFGIIYGISDFGLAQNLKISSARAKEYITKYFLKYPKIKEYLHSSVDDAKKNGFVVTVTGRRRQIPEIMSSNFQLRSFGERAAMNMPLQGSAADIIKIAMINVDKVIKKKKLKSKLILQVHDELIIDTFIDELDIVKTLLQEEMENAVKTKVKLEVNVAEGKNLYESK